MAAMSSNGDPILVSLRIPSEQRTKRDLLPIIEFVKGLKFFHSFSEYPQTVEDIATQLELQRFENGEHVFNEGELGDRFYIVLDGEISIIKRKRVHALIDFITENVVLVKLGCGKYFGETALESAEGLRTASAVATKPSILLSLVRHHYQTILFELKKLLRVAVRTTLSSPSSIFSHFPPEHIERLSELVVIRTFSLHEEIYCAGHKLNSLMVVKSGMVKLVKAVSRCDMHEAFTVMEEKYAQPKAKSFSCSPSRPQQHDQKPPGQLVSPSRAKTPALSLKTKYSGRGSPQKIHKSIGGSTSRDTPPGYWILTQADEFLDSSRPMKAVTEDMLGVRMVTEMTRGSIAPMPEEEIEFTVAVLMPGQVLGEISILDAEQSTPVTAVAATAVELYCFDCELLHQMGIMEDMRVMRSLLDDWKFRNPPQREILKQLQAKYAWERRKINILEHHELRK